jgi:hypothetical protein
MLKKLLHSLFALYPASTRQRRRITSRAFRPGLQPLEDRVLLSTLEVVPANVAATPTKFHTLQDAFNAAAPSGDTIQIDLNSMPGALVTSQTKSILIEGDPNYQPANLPVLNALNLGGGDFTLLNLNLRMVRSTAPDQIYINNSRAEYVTYDQQSGYLSMSGDTITGSVALSNSPGLINNCQFQQDPFVSSSMLQLIHAHGTTVSSNVFTSAADMAVAVEIDASSGVVVGANTITLKGANGVGIQVQNVDDVNISGSSTVSATLTGNTIHTGQGVGIATFKSAGYDLTVNVAGNDLTQNLEGLAVHGDGTDLGTVDAGSIGGSLGLNHFEGFTNTGPGDNKAIATFDGTTGVVEARSNFFSVFDGSLVCSAVPGTKIDTGSRLNTTISATDSNSSTTRWDVAINSVIHFSALSLVGSGKTFSFQVAYPVKLLQVVPLTSPQTLPTGHLTAPQTLPAAHPTSPQTLPAAHLTAPQTLPAAHPTSPQILPHEQMSAPQTLPAEHLTAPATLPPGQRHHV